MSGGTSVSFLQSDYDEAKQQNPAGYKQGNTDLIRQMLREQQKSQRALHSNALFREVKYLFLELLCNNCKASSSGRCVRLHPLAFLQLCGASNQKKFGKGYAVPEQLQPSLLVDDFQAEGQSRMFDLIKTTAVKEEKPLKGVWASFGKPYICLGDPENVGAGMRASLHVCCAHPGALPAHANRTQLVQHAER